MAPTADRRRLARPSVRCLPPPPPSQPLPPRPRPALQVWRAQIYALNKLMREREEASFRYFSLLREVGGEGGAGAAELPAPPSAELPEGLGQIQAMILEKREEFKGHVHVNAPMLHHGAGTSPTKRAAPPAAAAASAAASPARRPTTTAVAATPPAAAKAPPPEPAGTATAELESPDAPVTARGLLGGGPEAERPREEAH